MQDTYDCCSTCHSSTNDDEYNPNRPCTCLYDEDQSGIGSVDLQKRDDDLRFLHHSETTFLPEADSIVLMGLRHLERPHLRYEPLLLLMLFPSLTVLGTRVPREDFVQLTEQEFEKVRYGFAWDGM